MIFYDRNKIDPNEPETMDAIKKKSNLDMFNGNSSDIGSSYVKDPIAKNMQYEFDDNLSMPRVDEDIELGKFERVNYFNFLCGIIYIQQQI